MSPRVALLTRALRCGGVSTFLFRLGRELAARGCEVEIVTTEGRGEWFDLAASHGLRPQSIYGAGWNPAGLHARRVGRHLRERDYDAILLNHALHAQVALGMLSDRAFVVPILHNDIEEIVQVGLGNPAAWNVAVAVSPRLLEIARARRPERSSTMIPHGIEIPEEAPVWIERKQEARPLRLAYVGSVEAGRKGVMLLPEILRGARDRGCDAHLAIAGGGPDQRILAGRFTALGLSDRVKWLGIVEPQQIRLLLQDAHILLLPSRHEGFGLVLIEAQAHGCVPIASRLPGITDFAVADGRTGFLVAPDDGAAMVEGIVLLDRDRNAWGSMAREGVEEARTRFPAGRMGEEYMRLILEGLEGRYPLAGRRDRLPSIDRDLLTWRGALPTYLLVALRRARGMLRRFAGFA